MKITHDELEARYLAAVDRIAAMDAIDGGESPDAAVVTAIFALAAGLNRSGSDDECLWDAYAMLVKAGRSLTGRDFGPPKG